jgi:hypothetical protein
VGLTRYTGGYLCGCTAKGYWENLTETAIDPGTNVCNFDNNSCTYTFSGTLNRYIFEGNGCNEDIIASCHLVGNGFPYCFTIYFEEN